MLQLQELFAFCNIQTSDYISVNGDLVSLSDSAGASFPYINNNNDNNNNSICIAPQSP